MVICGNIRMVKKTGHYFFLKKNFTQIFYYKQVTLFLYIFLKKGKLF